jgi:hypothetical protein
MRAFKNRATVSVVSSSTTVFRVRYAEIVAADVGATGGDHTQNQSSDYTVAFNVTAPGAYRLNVSTSVKGAFTRVDDGYRGSVDMSQITGTQTGGTIEPGGTLTIPDPGVLSSSGGSADVDINLTRNATITGSSNGVAKPHTLRFTWSASATSDANITIIPPSVEGGDEVALRLGLPATFTNQTAGTYGPGSPGSRPIAPDGHWVSVSLESLCGNGTIDGTFGETCDEGANNGLSTSCCNSNCTLKSAGAVCRPAAGVCDVQETCTGTSGACPANGFTAIGTVCRSAAGICDSRRPAPAACCPGDGFFTGPVCRSAAGGCDVAETCPAARRTVRPAKRPSGFVCRSATGVCDVAETCNGTATACPADAVAPTTTVCRGAAGVCDVAESCDGTNKTCPSNAIRPNGFTCRPVNGICDEAETCNGLSIACPPDAFLGSTSGAFVCRGSAGICDLQDVCDGSGPNCPPDAKAAAGTNCRNSAGACDPNEDLRRRRQQLSGRRSSRAATCRAAASLRRRQKPAPAAVPRVRQRLQSSATVPLGGRCLRPAGELLRHGSQLPRRQQEYRSVPYVDRPVRSGRELRRRERRLPGGHPVALGHDVPDCDRPL